MPASTLPRAAASLGALLLTLLTLVAPAPALAGNNGGVGTRVDGTPGSMIENGFITLTTDPGGTSTGHFFISNTENHPVQLSIYPADGLTGATTGVVYGDAGDALIGAGAWVKPSIGGAVVQAGSETQVDFTVTVPPGSAAGDHVAAVVLQQNRPGSVRSGSVTQVIRNVVPLMIDVPGAASPQVTVRSANISTLPGTTMPAVTVSLRNTGLRLCRPTLSVGMDGPSESGQPVTRQLDTILPGDRAPYPLPWPKKITAGTYLVNVTASGCGATRTFKITAKTPDELAPVDPNANRRGGKTPTLITDATPGTSQFIDPSRSDDKKTTKRKKKSASDGSDTAGFGASGSQPPSGGSSSGPGGLVGSGATAGGKSGDGWLARAADAVKVNAPAVLKRATVPLAVLALIGLIFIAQEAIDRRDPKLALAPLHREADLPFDPNPLFDSNPLATRGVIPLSTALPGEA